MQNFVIYSHHTGADKITQILEKHFGEKVKTTTQQGMVSIKVDLSTGFIFKTKNTLELNYRQRDTPSYQLTHASDALTANLLGMNNLIGQLPAQNRTVQGKLQVKVAATNVECAVIATPEFTSDYIVALREVCKTLDAFCFATQPNAMFPSANGFSFYNDQGKLLLNQAGACEVDDLDVQIDAKYFDAPHTIDNSSKAQQRKARSIQQLQGEGVPTIEHLPALEEDEAVALPTQDAVIDRALGLFYIGLRSEGMSLEDLKEVEKSFALNAKLSPWEAAFMATENPPQQDIVTANWRYESLWTLLWALGYVEKLAYPTEYCDVPFMAKTIFHSGLEGFRQKAKLRSKAAILDQADLHYRYHWATVNNRIKGLEPPANIDASVVYEHRYALNWLIGNCAWEDVAMHT
jgi:Domain of unknown function (DUF4272)